MPRYNWNIVESGIKRHKPTNKSMCCYNAIVCCCELVLTKYQLGSFHSLKAFKIVIIIHILFNKKCLKNTKYKIELNTLVNGCSNFQYNTKYNRILVLQMFAKWMYNMHVKSEMLIIIMIFVNSQIMRWSLHLVSPINGLMFICKSSYTQLILPKYWWYNDLSICLANGKPAISWKTFDECHNVTTMQMWSNICASSVMLIWWKWIGWVLLFEVFSESPLV